MLSSCPVAVFDHAACHRCGHSTFQMPADQALPRESNVAGWSAVGMIIVLGLIRVSVLDQCMLHTSWYPANIPAALCRPCWQGVSCPVQQPSQSSVPPQAAAWPELLCHSGHDLQLHLRLCGGLEQVGAETRPEHPRPPAAPGAATGAVALPS